MSARDALSTAQALVMGLADAAVLLDRELRPIVYNAAFVTMSGLRARVLEQRMAEMTEPFGLLGQDPVQDRASAQLAIRTGRAVHLAEIEARNSRGQTFIVLESFLPVRDTEGAIVGIVQSFRDVSDEARVQKGYQDLLHAERARADELERHVERRTRELTAALAEVTRLSRTDPLTGLLNRRAFAEHADQALRLARRHDRGVALLLADLDHFKRINDAHGHHAGDTVLVAAARALRNAVRDSDRVARFGGEEFVILLTETIEQNVEAVGQRCREAIAELAREALVPNASVEPTLSVGIATYPRDGATLDALVARADQALYHAKKTGRNRVVVYDEAVVGTDPVPTASPAIQQSKPRVLLVETSAERRAQYARSLEASCEVVLAESVDEALSAITRDSFDAMVASERIGSDSGVEFLRRSLRVRYDVLRILVIDTEDMFVEIRGTALARVDYFLLHRDGPSHLSAAIEDGLMRRELNRQRLLTSTDYVRQVYASHIDELERILEQKALRFAYQPIREARTKTLMGYEALCRVEHPVFGNPVVLFEAAIRSGNVWRLGRLAREIAAEPLEWLESDTLLFINLHPTEIDDPELLDQSTLSPDLCRRVVFEITERGCIPDFKRFRENLGLLREKGFRFAIDDLGAGYASLNSVALLAPDFLKIDMALVRELHTSATKTHLVRRIVQFANDMGIRVVAEGIESPQESDLATELGVHLLQGFLYGSPAILRRETR